MFDAPCIRTWNCCCPRRPRGASGNACGLRSVRVRQQNSRTLESSVIPPPMHDTPSPKDEATQVDASESRGVAVQRLARGTTAVYGGAAGFAGGVIADLAGVGGAAVQVVQFGAALLIWLGCVMMATGVPHLMRFGTRRSVAALLSFAVAGVTGLVAVAEMFESFFLDSAVLAGLDEWALLSAVILVVLGGVLLNQAEPDSDGGAP